MKWIIKWCNAINICFTWAFLFTFFISHSSNANGLVGFELLDASANTVIQGINNQDTIELYSFNQISIQANTFGTVSKVEFYWNGSFVRSESSAPYCIAGDQAGDYNAWHLFDLNIPQQIKAIAYSGAVKIDSIDISFVFENTGPPRIPDPPNTFTCSNQFDVLVYNEESNPTHNSVISATNLIKDLGINNGFTVTVDSTGYSFDNLLSLKEYEVIIFANTNGSTILNAGQKQNFEFYIQQGGGFVGIHSAANSFRYGSWPWYNELVGAIPRTGPKYTPNSVSALVSPLTDHSINASFPSSKLITEKYYYWDGVDGYFSPNNNVLLEVASTGAQTYDAARAVSWYKEYDGGRSYYISIGHNANLYSPGDSDYIQHLLNGIKWAADKKLIVCGDFKKWHTLDFTFTGPYAYENGGLNTFSDYRLTVTFTNGTEVFVVPGYFAGDGYASESGAYKGDKWRVHFVPNKTGVWNYSVSFVSGNEVAINSDPGTPVSLIDGISGSFTIIASDKTGKDFRAKGRLKYVGEHYLQFEETGDYFIKGGTNSPENFLGYYEFDGTYDNAGPINDLETSVYADGLHHYDAHVQHWNPGDPVWQQTKGKGIIGSINYLSLYNINSIYMLVNNVEGDGREVFPWTSYQERVRFDVSKLDQWNIVFKHMQEKGISAHLVLQEAENDQLLDGGTLGLQRKLYYREMIARFSHHLGINWNMGEENTNTDQQRKDFATYFKNTDSYENFVSVHTAPGDHNAVYTPLLGFPDVDGASVQTDVAGVHNTTKIWKNNSANAGLKWIINMDETGPPEDGALPDGSGNNHAMMREDVLWGNLMAGGGGVEWYFGYDHPNNDLDCEDFSTRQNLWRYTKKALKFFNEYIPFIDMDIYNTLTSTSTNDYCFAKPGEVYAIYLPDNTNTSNLDLQAYTDTFNVQWFNPRNGTTLETGTISTIQGPGIVSSIGYPPGGSDPKDWVALITSSTAGALSLSSIVVQPTCYQDADGSISLNISGGNAPYTYLWSNNSTNANLFNIGAGVYTVTVTDSLANTVINVAELIEPSPIQVQSNINSIPCSGMMNGSVSLVVNGGQTPYNYSWSTNPGLNSPNYNNMIGGFHQVTITDNSGCSIDKSIWINEPSPLISMYIPQHPNCFGTATGAVNLLVSGGVAPYTHVWSSGETTEDISNVYAGIYYVQVTDMKGCASLVSIILNDPQPITYSATINDVSSIGGNDGSIILNTSSVLSPNYVSWNAQPGNYTNSAFNLTAGYYSFTITDANACTLASGETVNEPESVIKQSDFISNGSLYFQIIPNPSGKDNVLVQLIKANESITTLSVLNSIGKLVYQSKMDKEEYNQSIPVSDLGLNAGLYYVKLENKEINSVVKLLVY